MGKVLHVSVVSEGLLNSILNKFTLFTLLYIIFLMLPSAIRIDES